MASLQNNIYELVGQSSVFSLVSLFVPMAAGLYWKRATNMGSILSIFMGMAGWILFEYAIHTETPSLIHGLLASILGMVVGSLAFQDKSFQKFQLEKAYLNQQGKEMPDLGNAEDAAKASL
jgi:Na+/proline symporter